MRSSGSNFTSVGAGDGRAAGQILIHERAHDALFKMRLEVDHVVRKIQMLRDTLGVIDVVQRAATMLRGTAALQFRKAALIPKLHGQADDGAALLLQKRGHGRAVHAARHGDRDDVRFRGVRRGQRVELCFRVQVLSLRGTGTLACAPLFHCCLAFHCVHAAQG